MAQGTTAAIADGHFALDLNDRDLVDQVQCVAAVFAEFVLKGRGVSNVLDARRGSGNGGWWIPPNGAIVPRQTSQSLPDWFPSSPNISILPLISCTYHGFLTRLVDKAFVLFGTDELGGVRVGGRFRWNRAQRSSRRNATTAGNSKDSRLHAARKRKGMQAIGTTATHNGAFGGGGDRRHLGTCVAFVLAATVSTVW